MKHHPITKEQCEILNQDLATIMQRLSDITNLLNACYGNNDPRAARAEESQAALQRLLWALERQKEIPGAGNKAGSERVRQVLEIKVGSHQ
jgi:hypothetical protein